MRFQGDVRDLLINIWGAVEQSGGHPNINAVLAAARALGATFKTAKAREILLSFGNDEGTFPEHSGNIPGTKNRAQGNNSGAFPEQPENIPDNSTSPELAMLVERAKRAKAINAAAILPRESMRPSGDVAA